MVASGPLAHFRKKGRIVGGDGTRAEVAWQEDGDDRRIVLTIPRKYITGIIESIHFYSSSED